ncbi:MAG: TIGR01841 family phasin [Pseudomonadota bacterium]
MSKNHQNNENQSSGPKFEMPNFELPRMEVPAAFRDLTEKSVQQTKENYERLKQAAEETSKVAESAFSAYSKGSLELTSQFIETAKAQTNAMFDFAKSLMESQTIAEAFEKQTSFARSQFETLTKEGQKFHELSKEVANNTVAPIKSAAEKAANQFKKTA